ncbi:hypothetical protein GCM10027610_040080 [Dactylosporangium cerinum]
MRCRWKPTVTPAIATRYPPTSRAVSSTDRPQPQATGTAASSATNGAATNTHNMTSAPVDWVPSSMGFGPGNLAGA